MRVCFHFLLIVGFLGVSTVAKASSCSIESLASVGSPVDEVTFGNFSWTLQSNITGCYKYQQCTLESIEIKTENKKFYLSLSLKASRKLFEYNLFENNARFFTQVLLNISKRDEILKEFSSMKGGKSDKLMALKSLIKSLKCEELNFFDRLILQQAHDQL